MPYDLKNWKRSKNMISYLACVLIIAIFFLSFLYVAIVSPIDAQNSNNVQDHNQTKINIPTTVSKEAEQALRNFKSDIVITNLPEPNDLEAWKQLSQQREINRSGDTKGLVYSYQANATYTRIGNASIIDIKPKNWIFMIV